jgi:precorrin-4/cobalt-precorrin-4 C11-methyltransferase
MTVHIVGAGPGDPELLTRKADRLLRSARICIWAGSLINPQILDLLPADCVRHDSAGLDLDQTTAICAEAHARGLDVVRLHTGEPALYGAIAEQMRRLDAQGIPYTQVPGISAWQAVAATLRVELTAPEIAQAVVLGRVSGRTPVPAAHDLTALAALRTTLCLYLSVDRITEIAAACIPHHGADCPAAVVFHASWPDERVVRGTLSDIAQRVAAEDIRRTALVVIGRALAGTAPESRLYAADFAHGFREART